MREDLEAQAEKIIKSRPGRWYDVIVHVSPPAPGIDAAFQAGLAVLRSRAMIFSPSDVLPPPRKAIEEQQGRSRPAKLDRRGSLLQQVTAHSVPGRSVAALRKDAQKRIAGVVRQIAPGDTRHPPQVFWSSNSVSMRLTKDQLRSIPTSGVGVSGIYANRTIPPPRYGKLVSSPGKNFDPHAAAWGVERTGALAAWGAFGARGRGTKVAVLDTGIDPSHSDLSGKIAGWAEFDRNGAPIPRSKRRDTDKHGTHVAGTVCGGNVSGRHIGMAPEASLLVALVLDGRKGGTDAQILAGIDWAIEQGADVINLSLGGLSLDPIVTTVYQNLIVKALRAGIPVVAAIGNDGQQTTGAPGNDLFAFSVGAVDRKDRCAGFSGGRTQVIRDSRFIDESDLPLAYSKPDVSAPGVGVYSAVPGGKWDHFNGTSMATPHVSGAIAQLLSATNIKRLTGPQRASVIQDLLIGSSTELGESGQDHRFGFGRIDVFSAIDNAKRLGY